MSFETDRVNEYSEALAQRAEAARPSVVAVRKGEGRHVSGLIWSGGLVVTSEQALPRHDAFEVVLPGGITVTAALVGRDPSTNIAVLRLPEPAQVPPYSPASIKTGALVLAYGSDGDGGLTARSGIVQQSGPAWSSTRGGQIEKRITLDIRLSRREEGGPVFDAKGGLAGMSALGGRGQILVIPTETLQRIVPQLEKHGAIARGWLGVKLQPVAVPDALQAEAGQSSGMMAMSVAEDGPSAKAGCLAGDIFLSIGSAPARRVRQVAALLGPDSIGRTLDARVIRGGLIHPLSLTIEARPAE
jgi:S1-C subfamily serine protease